MGLEEPEEHEDGQLPKEATEEESQEPGKRRRHRKRIKIRKRVKIKRKESPKKKARKLIETVAWVIVVAAFIVTLIILLLQLDFSSKQRQKSRSVNERFHHQNVKPKINNQSYFV
jgi:hypothetical protein